MPHDDPTPTLTLRRLTPALSQDFLQFMDGPAFADHPRWRGCYCQFGYTDHTQVRWDVGAVQANRAAACERIDSARMHGVLAYRAGEVVGWCNAAPRTLLGLYADEPDPEVDRLGQITCFVVAHAHRRTGVARALLEEACALLRDLGMAQAEAATSRTAVTDAALHEGPLALYLQAGFAIVREEGEGRVVLRRGLG